MKALLQKQQQEEAMRNMLKSTNMDRSVEERVAACKEIQYEKHIPLFAVYYTTIHKAAQDNSIAGLKFFLHEQNKSKNGKNARAVGSRTRKGNKFASINPDDEFKNEQKEKKKVQVDDMDDFGYAAIHYVAERQCIDAMEYLLTQQVNLNLQANFSGNTAFMCAAKENKLESIRLLFAHHADLFTTNCTGMNMIHFAAQGNHAEVLLTILDVLEFEGLDVLAKRYNFKRRGNDRKVIITETIASTKGSGKASKKAKKGEDGEEAGEGLKLPPIRGATPLLEGKANNEQDNGGDAEDEQQEERDEETLPSHRSGFSSQSGQYQMPGTPLMSSSNAYSMSTFLPPLPYQPSRFSSLLEQDEADAEGRQHAEDDDDDMPKQAVSSSGYGAKQDTMSLASSVEDNKSQITSTSMLSINQQQQFHIAKTIGKLFNQASHNHSTPLHVACQYNSARVVQLLLDLAMMGIVKMEIQDTTGETPLHRAGRQGYRDLFQMITSYGASTTIENMFHETPRDLLVDGVNY